MHRYPTWAALAFSGTLLFLLPLAACAPATAVNISPTATTARAPTALQTAAPTVAPAPTPTNVPPGWSVLTSQHFSLAYPPGWAVQTPETNTGAAVYFLAPPTPHNQGVMVSVYQLAPSAGSANMAPYCLGPGQDGLGRVRLAGLAMAYQFGTGEGASMRSWTFVNAQRTLYTLNAVDAQGTTAVRAQDDSLLATFRADNAEPWRC
jgi:hypothetical protein